MLWAILSLVLPVTFGHTTACRSLALVFSAMIHFAIKCSAPCSAVLRYFPSSWAAVVHWSALMPKALRSSRKHPIHSFSWPPTQPAPPTIFPNIFITINSRLGINRACPACGQLSSDFFFPLSPSALEDLVPRDSYHRPVSRQPASSRQRG